MKTPNIPLDEQTRLEKLYSLNVLDTETEERFERITRITKALFDVPIVLVSLVDSDRQWFKSKQGLDASETCRDNSFCAHAINETKVFVIENALEDERFFDNPLVTGEPNIRFYAGCPLTMENGSALGTLCIIDTKPRTFDETAVALLEDLGAITEIELLVENY